MISPRKGLAILPALCAISLANAEPLSFNRDIRPILSDNCFACHGFDAKERKADLRLDTEEGAFADLGGYFAIKPGEPEKSEVWLRIDSTDEEEIMPPPDFHKTLTDKQKSTIKRWIEEGAVYEQHWSFISPEKVTPPETAGVKNPIDAFLQARLQKEKLTPAPEAPRET